MKQVLNNILNLKIIWLISLFSVILLLGFYIFQIGLLTQKIYLIKIYEKNLTNLTGQNKILEINLSKSDSLNNITNYLLNGNFVKTNANQVKYLQILGGTVVAK